jgi:hypothetical protein
MDSALPESARTPPRPFSRLNKTPIINRLQKTHRSTTTRSRLKYYKNVTFTLVCHSAPRPIINLSELLSDLRLAPHE